MTDVKNRASSRLQIVGDGQHTEQDGGRHSTVGVSCGGAKTSSVVSAVSPGDAMRAVRHVALVTLGCAKNLVDSEVMLGVLAKAGFRFTNCIEDAEVIVINTCGFIADAVKESSDVIRQAMELRSMGAGGHGCCECLIVTGCLNERLGDDMRVRFPEVDIFLPPSDLTAVADAVISGGGAYNSIYNKQGDSCFLYDENTPRVRSTGKHSAYIKVSEGCNRNCTFCTIPSIRGRMRSRPIASLVSEARAMVAEGVKEINLVAQDLTNYGYDFGSGAGTGLLSPGESNPVPRGKRSDRKSTSLVDLLRSLSVAVGGNDVWIRLLYAYPVGVSDELLTLLQEDRALCSYLDLPLQHISDRVLKSMGRPLGERKTKALIRRIRELAPDVAIRTTFIVGFPGETEEDFQTLCDFVKEGHFSHVGVFLYSAEEGTPAYDLDGQINMRTKKARRKKLLDVQYGVVESKFAALSGKVVRVLLESYDAEHGLYRGRTSWQAPEVDGEVMVVEGCNSGRDHRGAGSLIGEFVDVCITGHGDFDLEGEIVIRAENNI